MTRRNGLYLSLLFCALFVLQPATAGEATTEDTVHRGVSAKPIKRTAPLYPAALLHNNQQGWVKLSYVVTEDGAVIDPVVEESSGPRAFERAALNTVKRWSYEPATWDGETVQQCQTKVMISFAIEGSETAVSRKFHSRYRKIDKVIAKGDLEKAGTMLDATFEDYNMTLSELAWLWALRARYATVTDDKEMQLKAVRKATANNGRWIDKNLYPKLLYVRTLLELENQNLPEALGSYEKLVKLDSDYPGLDTLRPYIDKVQNIRASESIISIDARIEADDDCDDCVSNWHYDPLRRKFQLTNIQGELGDLELRCAWQRIVDKAQEGKSWDLPADWGNCSIIVFGEPGATFRLLEEPSA